MWFQHDVSRDVSKYTKKTELPILKFEIILQKESEGDYFKKYIQEICSLGILFRGCTVYDIKHMTSLLMYAYYPLAVYIYVP